MKASAHKGLLSVVALWLATSCYATEPLPLDEITVMALGALDGRAVIQTADGKMQVLKLGDTIAGTGAVVTQVLNDKLIMEETIAGEDGQSKVQTVWISKPAKPGERSAVQRFSADAPPQQISVQQVMQVVEPPNQ